MYSIIYLISEIDYTNINLINYNHSIIIKSSISLKKL